MRETLRGSKLKGRALDMQIVVHDIAVPYHWQRPSANDLKQVPL